MLNKDVWSDGWGARGELVAPAGAGEACSPRHEDAHGASGTSEAKRAPGIAEAPPAERLAFVTVAVEDAPPAWAMPDLLFWWAPGGGVETAGLGVALEVTARGPNRFAEVRRRGAEALARVTAIDLADAPAWTPRLHGGFAFAPGAADEAPWSAFGDAWFGLPRVMYRREGNRGWLSLVVDGSSRPEARSAARERAEDEAARLVRRMRATAAAPEALPPVEAVRQLDPALWSARVEEIRAAIAAGQFEKIVAARRAEVELAAPVDHALLLARLDARQPDCFRFAFRRGGALFAGASPERLISRSGDLVESEALAGSISGGSRAAASTLLASRKDLGEHAVVTRAIARALAPVCSSIDMPAAPEVRELRHVMHLCTSVRGRLERPRHVVDLAAALHPTPAVGGEPSAAAQAWIAGTEETPRGWYAGAVGWFDAAGDGELAVAIRSGLVAGHRAYVYAGAGIVAESSPEAEYAETGLKQRALLDVLGAGDAGR
jgi:isochorismate synthase